MNWLDAACDCVCFLCLFCVSAVQYYRASSRQLKRMDAISRSPIFSTFSETLMGLDSIRAYDQKQRFMDILLDLVNLNVAAYYPLKVG